MKLLAYYLYGEDIILLRTAGPVSLVDVNLPLSLDDYAVFAFPESYVMGYWSKGSTSYSFPVFVEEATGHHLRVVSKPGVARPGEVIAILLVKLGETALDNGKVYASRVHVSIDANTTVNLTGFSNIVVLLQQSTSTSDGGVAGTYVCPRVSSWDPSTGSLAVQMQSWQGARSGDSIEASLIVFEQGWYPSIGAQVGAVDADQNPVTVDLKLPITGALAAVNTMRGWDRCHARVIVKPPTLYVMLEEYPGCNGPHVYETLGYIAFTRTPVPAGVGGSPSPCRLAVM